MQEKVALILKGAVSDYRKGSPDAIQHSTRLCCICQTSTQAAPSAYRGAGTERAARLWGAAEALREVIGSPRPPNEREEYERGLATVREALGEEVFSAAWAEGRAMSLEQAIEYALQNSAQHKG